MIGTLLDKLLDKLLDLSRERIRLRESVLSNHLEPTYAAFNSVHSDYLESLESYRRIAEEAPPILVRQHPLIEQIVLDSVLSQHLRNKVQIFAKLETPPVLKPFVDPILSYLKLATREFGGRKLPTFGARHYLRPAAMTREMLSSKGKVISIGDLAWKAYLQKVKRVEESMMSSNFIRATIVGGALLAYLLDGEPERKRSQVLGLIGQVLYDLQFLHGEVEKGYLEVKSGLVG